MAYKSKFVVSVKCDGIFIKPKANDVCIIPFGKEYSLFLLNKTDRRAAVQILIDGEDINNGKRIIVGANTSEEIDCNTETLKKFKFVSLESHEAFLEGKAGPNEDKQKGVVECRWFLEKEKPPTPVIREVHHHYPPVQPWIRRKTFGAIGMSSRAGGQGMGGASCELDCAAESLLSDTTPKGLLGMGPQTSTMPIFAASMAPPVSDGATVTGADSAQRFTNTYMQTENDFVSVKLFLQGYTEPKVEVKVASSTLAEENLRLRKELQEEIKQQDLVKENKRLREELEQLRK